MTDANAMRSFTRLAIGEKKEISLQNPLKPTDSSNSYDQWEITSEAMNSSLWTRICNRSSLNNTYTLTRNFRCLLQYKNPSRYKYHIKMGKYEENFEVFAAISSSKSGLPIVNESENDLIKVWMNRSFDRRNTTTTYQRYESSKKYLPILHR